MTNIDYNENVINEKDYYESELINNNLDLLGYANGGNSSDIPR